MASSVREWIGSAQLDLLNFLALPLRIKTKCASDYLRRRNADPGVDATIDACIAWLRRAQEQSATHDGGAAHSFSWLSGWGSSYPETTGYIIPTLIDYSKLRGDDEARQSALRMLDWLVSIQMPEGAFQGGQVDSVPRVPVIFNTGQILLGLAAGAAEFGDPYLEPMRRAADWLVAAQDADGCWRKHASPFAMGGERTYDTHVAWGLFEAARVEPGRNFGEAGLANVRWALGHQTQNGWFEHCCLSDPTRPLTHTLGYTLRGVVEAFRFSQDQALLAAAKLTADSLTTAVQANGFIPGRLLPDWRPAVSWACLTGSVQISLCWMMLYEITGEHRYLAHARNVNRYVRTTLSMDGEPDMRGGVGGAFPIYGDYGQYSYLNWAAKFCADANMLEGQLTG